MGSMGVKSQKSLTENNGENNMYSTNRRGLTVDDCVHMALHTSNIHLRQYWMGQAQTLMNRQPGNNLADGGLTIPTGGLYRQQMRQAHRAKIERTYRYGTNY